jgi:hypothetical protein
MIAEILAHKSTFVSDTYRDFHRKKNSTPFAASSKVHNTANLNGFFVVVVAGRVHESWLHIVFFFLLLYLFYVGCKIHIQHPDPNTVPD